MRKNIYGLEFQTLEGINTRTKTIENGQHAGEEFRITTYRVDTYEVEFDVPENESFELVKKDDRADYRHLRHKRVDIHLTNELTPDTRNVVCGKMILMLRAVDHPDRDDLLYYYAVDIEPSDEKPRYKLCIIDAPVADDHDGIIWEPTRKHFPTIVLKPIMTEKLIH